MPENRTGNYTAFYVDEPFDESNLKAYATHDFCFYNMIKMWKANDSGFHFVNSHNKTYNVRDGSSWESTLKPRLHERLSYSKNIILILSSTTKNSRALREELDYGVNEKKLPVIVLYPDFSDEHEILDEEGKHINNRIKALWNLLPVFKDNMHKVATIHMPFKKDLLKRTLLNPNFTVQGNKKGCFFYPVKK